MKKITIVIGIIVGCYGIPTVFHSTPGVGESERVELLLSYGEEVGSGQKGAILHIHGKNNRVMVNRKIIGGDVSKSRVESIMQSRPVIKIEGKNNSLKNGGVVIDGN